ncbi:TPA: polymer-forming cytoskeletal protein, partial [Streptococcus suis]|nr:polymer-forming cytoskeletal protein [Streptococcus suis]
MTKKYELVLDDTIGFWGWKLFRIRALISFGSVEVGDLGGYIEKEDNLSHDGNA